MEDREVVKMWGKFFLALITKAAAAWFILLAAAGLYWVFTNGF